MTNKVLTLRKKYPKCFTGNPRIKKKCEHCGSYQPECWSAIWCAICTYPYTLVVIAPREKKKEPKRY